VGESFGGVVAQWYATLYPDHVSSLVLLSSLAKTNLPPSIAWKADNLLPLLKGVGYFAPGLAQRIFAQLHVDDVCEPSEPQFVKDLFIKEASSADFASVMARISLVRHLDIVEKSKSIRQPTLVVHGADDHFTKESSLELHGLIPSSTLRSLPGGHLPHITSPKEFADMIRSHVLVMVTVGGDGSSTD
jgi:proline iminopeptidase